MPSALLPRHGARWEAIDERSARVSLTIDGELIPLTLTFEADGRMRTASLMRWGDRTADGRFDAIPFGMDLVEEATFDGYTIPVSGRGGWWYGTDRYFDFFRPLARLRTRRPRFSCRISPCGLVQWPGPSDRAD